MKEVGPWNLDDNYWNPHARARSVPAGCFTDLPTGTPEAQAAFYNGYNTVTNCKDLDQNPTATPARPADQFGRCVLNPAGIDLSVAAAAQLGLGAAGERLAHGVVPLGAGRLDLRGRHARPASSTPASAQGRPGRRWAPVATIDVTVTGVGGVPVAGVAAVVLNVTATDVTAPETFLTVFPTGAPRPLASTLNAGRGADGAQPGRGACRRRREGVASTTTSATSPWSPTCRAGTGVAGVGARYTPVAPARVLDTRDGTGGATCAARWPAAAPIELDVRGCGGRPAVVRRCRRAQRHRHRPRRPGQLRHRVPRRRRRGRWRRTST